MARSRRHVLRSLLTPGSKRFWRLRSHEARLIFIALLLNADDFGRLEGEAQHVISLIPGLNISKKAAENHIRNLFQSGLIQLYGQVQSEDGDRFIYVTGFEESQWWHGVTKEPSKIPAPPDWIEKSTGNGVPSQPSPVSAAPSLLVSKRVREGEREGSGSESAYREARRVFHEVFPRRTFGTLGKRAGEWAGLVARFGNDTVVLAVRLWAENLKGSGGSANVKYPIGTFLNQSEECIEMAQMSEKEAEAEEPEDDFKPPPFSVEPIRYERKT